MSRYSLNFNFIKREVFILGPEMQLVVEWTSHDAWLTAISSDVLLDKPVVIGPVPVSARQIAELAAVLDKIRAVLRNNLTNFKQKKPAKATK